jgi:restriction system protein
MQKEISPSKVLVKKVMYETLKVLHDLGPEMRGSEVLAEVKRRVTFNEWELEVYEKNKLTRWETFFYFYSVNCVKAGFLIKNKGVWVITPEGEAALKLSPDQLLSESNRLYRLWRNKTSVSESGETELSEEDIPTESTQLRTANLDRIEELAYESIVDALNNKNAYEFQDIVAALLRAMGYYTPVIAAPGKDGGVDVVAYRDPLGTLSPRIKVQVKHQASSTPVQEVRQLMGLLQKDGDVGIFISSGGFTPDAKSTARGSHVHVELIDRDRFIRLWQDFYPKMSDDDKSLLRLKQISLVADE